MKTYRMTRVNRQTPCPICGHTDWCGVSEDGAICICMRIEEGSIKESRNGGYVHWLRDNRNWSTRPIVRRVSLEPAGPRRMDLDHLSLHFEQCLELPPLMALAASLGLSVHSLRRLQIGWDQDHYAWTFPMQNAEGDVVGMRLRLAGGRKLSIKGGREGLFIPRDLPWHGQLLICEGPTDTAAMLDLGFAAMGRPSCCGGTWFCVDLVRQFWGLDMVIMADADEPGRRGADTLAYALLAVVRSVRVICPPNGVKDARAWKQTGATAKDVQALINQATVRTLSIQGGIR